MLKMRKYHCFRFGEFSRWVEEVIGFGIARIPLPDMTSIEIDTLLNVESFKARTFLAPIFIDIKPSEHHIDPTAPSGYQVRVKKEAPTTKLFIRQGKESRDNRLPSQSVLIQPFLELETRYLRYAPIHRQNHIR
jgi:hypothetical protein